MKKNEYACEYWHLVEIFGKQFFNWEKLFIDYSNSQKKNNRTTYIELFSLNLRELERAAIIQALEKANWKQKDAAKLLGVSPRVLNYRIYQYGIKNCKWRVNC
ncbi:MAG: helix-turn-helix domain-containing protein [candidate division KSB1 bacterium]|nr:helix-turn-helix domain-containing protein [candidate division KSB1 bacterium]